MGTVVVIGNFDGAHVGHKALLRTAGERAAGRKVIALTFWPHPLMVLAPERAPELLLSLSERIAALKTAGADEVLVRAFTREFAALPPQRFITEVLLPLDPDMVVVGENFTFGDRARGDVATLRDAGRFEVVVVPLAGVEGRVSSSTLIRAALASGDVASAASHLGRPFSVTGEVVRGEQRGRALGYPTANLALPTDGTALVPADGVYAGWLSTSEKPELRLPAAISVGSNPTFEHVSRRVEAHVIGHSDLELYGKAVTVEFVTRLRAMVRFAATAELATQLGQDVAAARAALAAA
ncbi:MAG: bifunctional riboflavin kinase/FAD synthetase [Propionibacteriaceae bacterium]|jgi:riboflavin kinase/FMN adenylyltransferase|nr:bifunctional riboflavin kinase/FAD synthetase [Propionibacteriaceae bacterium]